MSLRKFLFQIQLCSLFSADVFAEPLEHYQKAAQENSPRLKAQQASSAAAKSNYLKESFLKENPDLMVGMMNVPVNSFPALNRDQMSGFVVGVSQKIALPWEDHYRKESGRYRAEFEERDKELLKASLIWEIAEKYNSLHYSYHRLGSLKEARKLLTGNLNILSRSVKLQKNIVPQILEARANLTTLDNEIITAEFEIEKLWLEFETLCGTRFPHEFSPEERKIWLAGFAALITREKFTAIDNLQYRKMRSEADAQLAMLSLRKSSLFPEVTLNAAYIVRQPVPGMSTGDNMVTVSASTPLPIFYPLKNKHEIEAQSEKVKYAEQILRETQLQVETAWRSEKLKLESLTRTIENYTNSILPAHSSAHKAHLATATAQGMGISEALQAYQMYVSANQERLKMIRDYYSSYYRLQFLSAGNGGTCSHEPDAQGASCIAGVQNEKK
jgi:outer membrane protein TolC